MKTLNMRQVVAQLEKEGHVVEYYVRNDGGILIRSIDGARYTGASGNKVARWMTGQELSQRRASQLERITYTGKRAKKIITNQKIRKALDRVQKKWRKAFPHGRGETPSVGLKTAKQTKWNLEHKGEEETLRLLKEAEKYAEGYAYAKNVEQLIDVIDSYLEVKPSDELKEVRNYILEHKDTFREEWMSDVYQSLYLLNKGYSGKEVADKIKIIIGME